MHRTTINLDEAIYRKVMRLAHSKGKSMARTIEELLRNSLNKNSRSNIIPPLHLNNGPLPGINIADRDRLYDLMEDR